MDIETIIKELDEILDNPPEGPYSHFVVEACEDAVDCINQLQQRVKELESALEDAMNWNWLDNDMPEDVVEKCENLLKAVQND